MVEFRGIRCVSQKRFHDSTPRFPPLAPAGNCSPASRVLSRRSDFLSPIPPPFVAFDWRYHGSTRFVSLPTPSSAAVCGPGVGHPVPPAGVSSAETTGSPKFLGNLDCPFARVLTDAGRTACTRPIRCSSVAPGPPSAKAPTIGLSTLNNMAFGLAVYASPGSLPHHDARLASGCWSGSTGWAFTHEIPLRGF